jgi:hypothetical protein
MPDHRPTEPYRPPGFVEVAPACPACDGRGYVLWDFPAKKPSPAYWFQRGRHGERPTPCERCAEPTTTRRARKAARDLFDGEMG